MRLSRHFKPLPDTASAWRNLARERGVLLPNHATNCSTGGMERWLRRLELGVPWFYGWTGCTRLSQWIADNPLWGLRSFAGLLLEEARE